MSFLVIFSVSFIQEILFFIPSSFVQIGSSFVLMSDRVLSLESLIFFLFYFIIPSTLGLTLGSWVFFLIFKKTKNIFSIKNLDKFNNKNLILLRAVPLFSNTMVNIFMSLQSIGNINFLLISFFGFLIRTTIQGLIGWVLFNLLNIFVLDYIYILSILFNFILILYIIYLIYKKYEHN